MRATVWSENYHERHRPDVAKLYPAGIHAETAFHLMQLGVQTGVATLDQPDAGLGDDVLDTTDVLFWWGHARHDAVPDHISEAVVRRVHEGMGFVALHSAMESKPFRTLMGTTCRIDGWRHGDREVTWTVAPEHPLTRGVPNPFVIEKGEMYCEPFDVPPPDDVIFLTSYGGGEAFRSGMTFQCGAGRVFYFAPGHEEYPIYRHPDVRRVLVNAAHWAGRSSNDDFARSHVPPASSERSVGWFNR